MKKWRVRADCLVDFCMIYWEVEAETEDTAWAIAYNKALFSHELDSGSVEVVECIG